MGTRLRRHYTRNTSLSATLSAAQVRSALHTRAFGEWRRYAAQWKVLEAALARASGNGTGA